MAPGLTLLLLAGSAEAREIAIALQDQRFAGLSLRALLSEPERGTGPFPAPHETRRFANAGALQEHLQAGGITAVLDASHSFDARQSAQGFGAAQGLALPYLRLRRAPWQASGQPRWHHAPSVRAASGRVAPGARAFATTGWDSQSEFAGFPGEKLLLRQTSSHGRRALYPFIEPVFGLPPFTKASETQLFEEMGVDVLIARNIGGERSRPKLNAATALGLDVLLVDPPAAPEGAQVVSAVQDALDWLAAL
ncbi:MAG: precorrin-6A/cobalt-precorrin-6A reductase [Sulfitobacter sp.]